MKVCIYANCQGLGIEKFLNIGLEGKCQTSVILNYEKLSTKQELEYNLISNCDLFIYHHLSYSHGVYSTDPTSPNGVIKYLKDDCIKISIPFVYNSSLWSMFIDGDEIVNKNVVLELKNKGYSLREVFSMYDKFELDFNYESRNKDCFNFLREREKNCEIKVADFMEDNMLDSKMLLTQNHPTSIIFVWMVNQILNILGKRNKLNHELYDENFTQLPCYYNHNKYDLKYWNFKYHIECNGDEWTKSLIKNVYE